MARFRSNLLPLCSLAILNIRQTITSSPGFIPPLAFAHVLPASSTFQVRKTELTTSAVRTLSSSASTGGQQSRPRRSVLFVPPRLERAVTVAKQCPADTLIFDLEDAVAEVHKDEARKTVLQAVQEGGFRGQEVGIRCNGLGTQWIEEDIRAIASSGVNACVVPKVESGAEVSMVRQLLRKYDAPAALEIWAMVETPLGVLQALEIAAASGGDDNPLRALVVGSSDLTKELRGQHTPCRHPLIPSLHLVLLAARARSLVAIDGVHFDIDNETEFLAHCTQGAEMGFDGKSLLHPSQIGVCNKLFPQSSGSEVAAARGPEYSTEWAYRADSWESEPGGASSS